MDAYLTRPGVFPYRMPDGSIRRELRHPDDVYDPASLETMRSKPTTLGHPVDASGQAVLVTPANYKDFATGAVVGDAHRDTVADRVRAPLMVSRADHIEAIFAGGVVEQSCGYTCELDETPGVDPVYGRYDARQTDIRYNHTATVPVGRAGRDVRLRADAALMIPEEGEMSEPAPPQAAPTPTPSPAPQPAAVAIDYSAQFGAMQAQIAQMMGILTERLAPSPEPEARADGAEGEEAARLAMYAERRRLESAGRRLKVDGLEGMTDAVLGEAIARARLGEHFRADAGEAYVAAIVDTVLAEPEPRSASSRMAGPAPRTDSALDARSKFQAALAGGATQGA